MSSEALHAPRERLSQQALSLHSAIMSLREELDAVDRYRQRVDDVEDGALKEVLLHTMREETEHSAMLLEWIRRTDADFDRCQKTCLFSEGAIPRGEGPIANATWHQAGTAGADELAFYGGFTARVLSDGRPQ